MTESGGTLDIRFRWTIAAVYDWSRRVREQVMSPEEIEATRTPLDIRHREIVRNAGRIMAGEWPDKAGKWPDKQDRGEAVL